MEFKSLKDMQNYIASQMKEVAKKELSKVVFTELKKFVKQNVYSAYNPSQYDRTYQLLNSVTIGELESSGKSIVCSVYFDPNKIKPAFADNFWNQHRSVFDYDTDKKHNAPINEMIPYYMNYGTDSPVYSHDETLFLEETIKSLNSGLLRSELIKFLKQRGIVAR